MNAEGWAALGSMLVGLAGIGTFLLQLKASVKKVHATLARQNEALGIKDGEA